MDISLFLQQSPWALICTVFIFSLVIGSFLNVVIYRIPIMLEQEWRQQAEEIMQYDAALETEAAGKLDNPAAEPEAEREGEKSFNLMFPNSQCPHCQHEIKPWENIPVLSYLLLKGKCSNCNKKISPRYPIVELATAVLSALVAHHYGFTLQCATVLLLTWALITLTLIDFDHQILPDNITLPFLWLGLLINIKDTFVPLSDAVVGACAGYLVLWSVYWLFKLVTGKEGMGYGDFKLLALLGAWMGWQYLPLIIILSSVVGAAVGISLILVLGRDKNIPIPFGPYLSAAGFIALLWGQDILNYYQQSFL